MDHTVVRRTKKIILLYDVDETLEISRGPVPISAIKQCRDAGIIVGICGNWAGFVQCVEGWQNLVSLMNIGTPNKETFLAQCRMYMGCDDLILVGNVLGEKNSLGVVCGSDDKGAVERVNAAGFPCRFIKEDDFKVEEFTKVQNLI